VSWVASAELEALRREKNERIDVLEREVYRLESIIDGLQASAAKALKEAMAMKDGQIARLQGQLGQITRQRDDGLQDYAHLAQQNAELRRQLEKR
jgi:chromosome segregation ATPase